MSRYAQPEGIQFKQRDSLIRFFTIFTIALSKKCVNSAEFDLWIRIRKLTEHIDNMSTTIYNIYCVL